MKVMDVSTEENDCIIETMTPIKKKKMKQAQLPFQLNSPQPNNKSKKRKLTSPSVGCKSPKVVKQASKENSDTKSVSNVKTVQETSNDLNKSNVSVKDENEQKEDEVLNEDKIDNNAITPKKPLQGKTRKSDRKRSVSNDLTKFLKKGKSDNKDDNSDKDITDAQMQDIENKDINKHQKGHTTEKMKGGKGGDIVQVEDSENKRNEDTKCTNGADTVILDSDSDTPSVSLEDEGSDKEEVMNNTYESVTDARTPESKRNKDSTKKAEAGKLRKLTPKQLEKKIESAKKREEREKLRLEKEKKREEERESRRKEKEEKRREKEEKEKAEKEQKRKEKEQRELKKQMEIEQRQKEKEAKEEERKKREQAKEEEKRKKEEEKLEAERKKQKAASNFASFFVAKKQESRSLEDETDQPELKNFMPFEIKADMKIAPISRRILTDEDKMLLDEKCNVGHTEHSNLYLEELRSKRITPRTSQKTWPLEAKDDIIVLDDDNEDVSNYVDQTSAVVEKHRPKLLQFTENRRPPYWGTWRKRSASVNPRRPFAKDAKCFDYEVDSDDEWEEEEPGESLRGSDDEKDEENPEDNEYDVDNEFMVPHGYLSDEEALADEEERQDMSPETQKFKLKLLGEEFEAERNVKTSKLQPKVIGCIWQGANNTYPDNVPSRVVEFLSARQAWVHKIPIDLPTAFEDANTNESASTQQSSASMKKRQKIPEEALPDLIRLLHGNTHSRIFLIKEFITYWGKKCEGENAVSKASLSRKIRDIGRWMACPEAGPMHSKPCWYVSTEIRQKYLPEEELKLPNTWVYNLTPKRKSEAAENTDKSEKEEKDKEKKNVPRITQFTKKITQEEMKKQLTPTSASVKSQPAKSQQQKPPKRAVLISVARGEQFSKSPRSTSIKEFVSTEKKKSQDLTDKKVVEEILLTDDDDEPAKKKST